MGCSGSKGEKAPVRRRSFLLQPSPNPTDQRLTLALRDLKKKMDEDQSEPFTFTKILLRLGTIEQVLRSIKAVFLSVDEGHKGHVTKDELKEGLRKAQVDLGDEWRNTNIDECLEHIGGTGADDSVGLKEFVVMLAVGRVCRPLKREQRSTVFVPLDSSQTPQLGTIKEGEKSSQPVSSVAAAAAEAVAEAAADDAAVEGAGSDGGGQGQGGEGGEEAKDDNEAIRAAAMTTFPAVPETAARAGPGGLPRGTSWRKLKWAKIPPLMSIDASGRPRRSLSRGVSVAGNDPEKGAAAAGLGGGVAGGDAGGNNSGGGITREQSDVSISVKYVLDLLIAAYFQFDPKAQGYIKKSFVDKKLRQSVREDGATQVMNHDKWRELSWDEGRMSFQEFIYGFAMGLGLDDDEEEDAFLYLQSEERARSATSVAAGGSVGNLHSSASQPEVAPVAGNNKSSSAARAAVSADESANANANATANPAVAADAPETVPAAVQPAAVEPPQQGVPVDEAASTTGNAGAAVEVEVEARPSVVAEATTGETDGTAAVPLGGGGRRLSKIFSKSALQAS